MTKATKKQVIILLLILLGVFLRFLVMTIGHNFDFDSYCIVGEISSRFGNVYALTRRYNYGPIFFCIQGLLYKIASFFPDLTGTYRVLMVSLLTIADLSIALFVAHRFNVKKALLFFLNPVSIIITGYHNQFDNIAVFFAIMSILYYGEEDRFDRKDFRFIVYLTLSLVTKHIFLFFPFFILIRKGLPFRKRILYSFIPPIIFLLSFVPFAIGNTEAFNGIIKNVFLYDSFNNSPLLAPLYNLIGFPKQYSKIVFGLLMAVVALITRSEEYEKQVYFYLIAMVAFSSAIANQYLVIPIVALIALETGALKYIYIVMTAVFLALQYDGLNMQESWIKRFMPPKIVYICDQYLVAAYSILAWILFIAFVYALYGKRIRSRIGNTNKPSLASG